jgi:2-C-methyl-D-erythritol 4-phosphate cytidylyltransferase
MNYAIILAAGNGSRTQNKKIKSVINIGNRPLFSYVLETFCKHKLIDKVILVINPQKQKLFKLGILSKNTKISICQGDNASRQNSLVNGFKHLGKIVKLKNNDIIITHDVARPFISPKIINDHIKNTKCYGYSTTLYQINDSMCEIIKNKINYLNRENKYIVQTPQSLLFKN